MSPSDFGRLLKPFVFLDLIDNGGAPFTGFGLHPHSGIATVTYIAEGSVRYEDTNGATGLLPAGGIEWMRAGGGVWHGGGLGEPGRTRGFQLWIALPPDLELGPSESIYLAPEAVPIDGPVRVLIGSYGTATSSIKAPSPMNYLAIRLKAGERWSYQPGTRSCGPLSVRAQFSFQTSCNRVSWWPSHRQVPCWSSKHSPTQSSF
jgi:redox-sensitive bicupin YhaK (pirin superfamily)